MPSTSDPRILIVDDNKDAATCLGRLLSLLGKEVRVANDGASALKEVNEFCPQLVLLDIGMPDMDGYEVARRIRAREDLQELMLVALTGWGPECDQQRVQDAGFDEHLVKPVELERLESLLEQWAARRAGLIPVGALQCRARS